MTSRATCDACAHANLEAAPDKMLVRQCRRYPPSVVPLQIPQQTPGGVRINVQMLSAWPTVEAGHHCSEFRADGATLLAG